MLFRRYSDDLLGTSNFKVSYSVSFASEDKPLFANSQSSGSFNAFDSDHQMQYLAGAPMFRSGAVFAEKDSSPDEANDAEIMHTIYSQISGQVSQKHVNNGN